MELELYTCPQRFLSRVGAYLLQAEPANSLPLGVMQRLAANGYSPSVPPFMAVGRQDGEVAVVLLMTPPHNLIMATGAATCDLRPERLVGPLLERGLQLPGVIGCPGLIRGFAERWARETGAQTRVQMRQRILAATAVRGPTLPAGGFRQARPADSALAGRWLRQFAREALPGDPTPDYTSVAGRLIASASLWFWEQERPVSMAASTRPTGSCVAINSVFTPRRWRGHGYASACVFNLTQQLLETHSHCVLYTDLDNPTSTGLYTRLGFEPVSDSWVIRFARP